MSRAAAADPGWEDAEPTAITLLEAIALAKRTVAAITDQPVDGIARSSPGEDGGWRIVVEVVESPARMGENDLLAAHEVTLAADGALAGIARLRRYRREASEE